MLQDVRYAWRMLVKSPWVTLAVLLSLGLGIGANVTIFSWVLAAIGLYGVISSAVSQRTREVGIRMALGAEPGDIWRMVLRSGATLSFLGMAIGLAGALLLMPQLSRLLIGVGPRDVITLVSVAGALALTAVVASAIPAQRASRIAPVIALRHL